MQVFRIGKSDAPWYRLALAVRWKVLKKDRAKKRRDCANAGSAENKKGR